MTPEERELWRAVYVAAIRGGASSLVAADLAMRAVSHYRAAL